MNLVLYFHVRILCFRLFSLTSFVVCFDCLLVGWLAYFPSFVFPVSIFLVVLSLCS